MKKIITVFDGSNFSETAFNFIDHLEMRKPALLVGIFLSSVDYSTVLGYPVGLGGYITAVADDYEVILKNIKKFKSICEKNGIEYRVHEDIGGGALELLKKETRFADLLVISNELFYRNTDDDHPGDYLKDVLQHSECPVLLLPEDFQFPNKTILAYDGSESSVYAIRQFSYLFPQLRGNKTRLVYASTKDEFIPDASLIEELVTRHFGDLSIQKLDIDPKKYFSTWIADRKNVILVTGAYSHSGFAALRKSFVSEIIADHRIPVFIAHK